MLRLAVTSDIPTLRAIERAAGAQFRDLAMDTVAEDNPPGEHELQQYLDNDRAWVVERTNRAVAYALARVLDDCGHVEQVSVHPEHAHQRLGAALVEQCAEWARESGLPALTLTTFREVPWNGPYYRRCGFRWLRDSEITPGLRTIREQEAAHGLDRWPRGCMRRELA